MPALGVAAVVNDELEALPEWVAFHLAVGVSHFLIADSGSTDGTLGYLRELEALGLVTLIQVPARVEEETPVAAYAELLARCPAGLDLLAFLDADDFLLPLEAEVGDALALRRWLGQRFADPDVSALALHRACFGSAGERFRGDGLVVERFTRRANRTFFANRRYRSVVRPARVRQFLNAYHAELTAGCYHDSQGKPLEVDPERPGSAVRSAGRAPESITTPSSRWRSFCAARAGAGPTSNAMTATPGGARWPVNGRPGCRSSCWDCRRWRPMRAGSAFRIGVGAPGWRNGCPRPWGDGWRRPGRAWRWRGRPPPRRAASCWRRCPGG